MSPEVALAEVLRDHLSSAEAVTAGLPSTSVAPRRAWHETGDKPKPCFTIAIERKPQTRTNVAELDVSIVLEICVVPVENETAGQTSPETGDAWMDALRWYLLDEEAFFAFLAAQDEEHRTGYEILDYRVEPDVKKGISKEEAERNYMQTMILTCRVV